MISHPATTVRLSLAPKGISRLRSCRRPTQVSPVDGWNSGLERAANVGVVGRGLLAALFAAASPPDGSCGLSSCADCPRSARCRAGCLACRRRPGVHASVEGLVADGAAGRHACLRPSRWAHASETAALRQVDSGFSRISAGQSKCADAKRRSDRRYGLLRRHPRTFTLTAR
jgi:hypothetical protein